MYWCKARAALTSTAAASTLFVAAMGPAISAAFSCGTGRSVEDSSIRGCHGAVGSRTATAAAHHQIVVASCPPIPTEMDGFLYPAAQGRPGRRRQHRWRPGRGKRVGRCRLSFATHSCRDAPAVAIACQEPLWRHRRGRWPYGSPKLVRSRQEAPLPQAVARRQEATTTFLRRLWLARCRNNLQRGLRCCSPSFPAIETRKILLRASGRFGHLPTTANTAEGAKKATLSRLGRVRHGRSGAAQPTGWIYRR